MTIAFRRALASGARTRRCDHLRTELCGQSNLPPSAGYQFFGQLDIDARSHDLVVQLKDTAGSSLFSQRLDAHPVDGWRDGD